ncbi:phosphoribosylformylglycinamidine cyclo-ligase [Stecheria sp. CLA-KB-P133]|uniref:Phosphoribosylformylglycinamidine cyclo-ligase n=1 Tax=Grylomicrobium aquisgranensis TaxID=2926318 RepID=A0AB35U2M5_9FIRM|nr:phosphoribosylformylglycinamidine cyclo-ligase [Stecheria sp. CLA-KB-P133]
MDKSYSKSYKDAGVDVTAGYRSVELMKKDVASTAREEVLDTIGGFGGLFAPKVAGMKKPVLVSGTDGVGTKLKIAFLMDKHDTVGIDCVAMCVNDVICAGAEPLFFLDYIACGKNEPEKIAAIVKGVANGCKESGCALIGGETAEHPGLMPEDEYDLAGFTVGMVEEEKILDKNSVMAGDVCIGLASSGVHSNGFSLVRKVFGIDNAAVLDQYREALGAPLGEVLLRPTKLYVKPVLSLLNKVHVKSIAHITGGGFYENMPRAFGENLSACMTKGSWPILPIFDLIQKKGGISEHDMFNTFNMGIGMMVIVAKEDVEAALASLKESNVPAYVIGEMVPGSHTVTFR